MICYVVFDPSTAQYTVNYNDGELCTFGKKLPKRVRRYMMKAKPIRIDVNGSSVIYYERRRSL